MNLFQPDKLIDYVVGLWANLLKDRTMAKNLVLSIADERGVKHEIHADDFAAAALNDIISRLPLLEAFVAELVSRDAIVGKDLREKAALFVKPQS